jgi:hypothetical protein
MDKGCHVFFPPHNSGRSAAGVMRGKKKRCHVIFCPFPEPRRSAAGLGKRDFFSCPKTKPLRGLVFGQMQKPAKGPRVSVVSPGVVAKYYERHFNWHRAFQLATCYGRYRLEQRVWWLKCHGYDLKRVMFDTIEALRDYVIKNKVLTIHLSGISVMGREAVAIAHAIKTRGADFDFSPAEMAEAEAETKAGRGLGVKLTNKILTRINRLPYSYFHSLQPIAAWGDRELVFDIDMNEYANYRDPVCDCGKLKQCCDLCWDVFITRTALPALKYMLEDFCGFKELVFTFSGRRGMHIQVLDERAMRMTCDERNKVFWTDLLGAFGHSKELRAHLLEKIYRPVFDQCIAPRLLSGTTVGTPTPGLTAAACGGGEARDELILRYLHVRVDDGFWKKDMGHHIKLPGTIHAETGNLCEELYDGFRPSLAKRADRMLLE